MRVFRSDFSGEASLCLRDGAGPAKSDFVGLAVVVLIFLVAPADLHGQRDFSGALESGDRVRVWSSANDLQASAFDFHGWQETSLVLSESREGDLTRLPRRYIDRLQVRKMSGGTNFWEGVALGGGIGFLAETIYIEAGGGCAFSYAWCIVFASPYTILPGAVVGGLVGSGLPEYEWVSVDVRPAVETRSDRRASGVSISVQFDAPTFP